MSDVWISVNRMSCPTRFGCSRSTVQAEAATSSRAARSARIEGLRIDRAHFRVNVPSIMPRDRVWGSVRRMTTRTKLLLAPLLVAASLSGCSKKKDKDKEAPPDKGTAKG